MSTTDLNTPDALAEVIRNAAAWWKLAAEKLDQGDLEAAHGMAKLGELGTAGMVETIGRVSDLEVTSGSDGGG